MVHDCNVRPLIRKHPKALAPELTAEGDEMRIRWERKRGAKLRRARPFNLITHSNGNGLIFDNGIALFERQTISTLNQSRFKYVYNRIKRYI